MKSDVLASRGRSKIGSMKDDSLSSGFTASRGRRVGRGSSRIDDVDEDVGRGPTERHLKIFNV